ncbi:hypothetical protein [Neisseria animalis]|uniref:Uncharacterized protein n=1 Tax=Neisseria animalis TaxID=492 RepID=A0A5P3MPQ3_NEIAN|nr:hypothetical protein [Neisseria animalis]QEY23537.1 hypothetical protein D0T90_02655 [Neisseria animalis]ROW32137.1 hypothetical protein CGZ60_06035 [Neisseria animalis]VEE09167.1 Uncharacterised protein [Neisseria animalis]
MTDDWLKREIARGFTLLAALNLKGRPAAKDLTAVAQVWHGLLMKQEWQPERDTPRIRAAFEAIAATSGEWPNPVDLNKHLPQIPVKMVPRLERKHVKTPYAAEVMAEIKSRLKNAPVSNRNWMHTPKSRTVDECKRIYAERQKEKNPSEKKFENRQ